MPLPIKLPPNEHFDPPRNTHTLSVRRFLNFTLHFLGDPALYFLGSDLLALHDSCPV
ncbi:MAG: hypothetical protein M0Z85_08815 [Gammaproteobacteria bacterium]|nr:hypothetical protein [Gammaproteobacteria bacterium]MDA8191441.1 hypothetical protein [Gammaproteobacteria bacterium]